MTDEERGELAELERRCAAHALAERELDRLYFLRLRAAGVATWREVLDAISAQIGPEPVPTTYPAWLERRHDVMLPPPGVDDGEVE